MEMAQRNIVFPCVNRTKVTRQVIHRAIRQAQHEGLRIAQISAQQAYNLPYICPSSYNRLIVPNLTTLGQIYAFKNKGFVFSEDE